MHDIDYPQFPEESIKEMMDDDVDELPVEVAQHE